MRIEQFTFGSIRIDGVIYEHDVVIARGRVQKRSFGGEQRSCSPRDPGSVARCVPSSGFGQ
jgi:hypothetical protein